MEKKFDKSISPGLIAKISENIDKNKLDRKGSTFVKPRKEDIYTHNREFTPNLGF